MEKRVLDKIIDKWGQITCSNIAISILMLESQHKMQNRLMTSINMIKLGT